MISLCEFCNCLSAPASYRFFLHLHLTGTCTTSSLIQVKWCWRGVHSTPHAFPSIMHFCCFFISANAALQAQCGIKACLTLGSLGLLKEAYCYLLAAKTSISGKLETCFDQETYSLYFFVLIIEKLPRPLWDTFIRTPVLYSPLYCHRIYILPSRR
jgi:hypothetical protein